MCCTSKIPSGVYSIFTHINFIVYFQHDGKHSTFQFCAKVTNNNKKLSTIHTINCIAGYIFHVFTNRLWCLIHLFLLTATRFEQFWVASKILTFCACNLLFRSFSVLIKCHENHSANDYKQRYLTWVCSVCIQSGYIPVFQISSMLVLMLFFQRQPHIDYFQTHVPISVIAPVKMQFEHVLVF